MSRRLLVLIAIGLVAGFFSGMFGVGGGVIIVPMLIAFAAYPPKTAMATSLAAILFTATAAAAAHANEGNVEWADAVLLGIPAVGGALIGAAWHQRASTRNIVLAFSTFLALVAVRLATQ